MAQIYLSGIKVLENEVNAGNALANVDKKRREEAGKFIQPKRRAQSLAAGLLIQHGAREFMGDQAPAGIYELSYTELGKPYFTDHPEIHFSVSHSGDMVLCAVSELNVGADIQEWKELTVDIAGKFYHPEEKKYLSGLSPSASEKAFFELWCLKESYIKFTGKGLTQRLDELDFHTVLTQNGVGFFEFTENDTRIRAELIDVPHGYSAAVVEELVPEEEIV